MKHLVASGIVVEKQMRRILDDVAIELRAGEFLGVIGPNGSGKSTLLRVLACLERLQAGRITLDGVDLTQLSADVRARRIGYHAQNPQLHWPLPVSTIVALGRLPYVRGLGALDVVDEQLIADAIEKTALGPLIKRTGDTLSGGELARVHIARLLAGVHDLIFADEPIANLDPRFQIEILNVLHEHAQLDCGVVVVLHDLNIAARHCDRLVLLNEGRVHAFGTPREVLTAKHLETVFGVADNYLQDAGIEQALGAQSAGHY